MLMDLKWSGDRHTRKGRVKTNTRGRGEGERAAGLDYRRQKWKM